MKGDKKLENSSDGITLDGHEFQPALDIGDGQGAVYCVPGVSKIVAGWAFELKLNDGTYIQEELCCWRILQGLLGSGYPLINHQRE